jgi:RNA polymerase sigma-70 factor (ECF subfamily)
MNEFELIKLAREGNKAATTRLLLDNRNMVAIVVNRLIFESDNRKDVIQGVFVKAIDGIRAFKGSCKFSTWLYRLAINEAIEYNRKKLHMKNNTENFTDEMLYCDSNQESGFEYMSRKEISFVISSTLQKLPFDQRTAFSLYYYSGYSGKEGADVMKITEDNFFMKLKTARDRVRRSLVAKGIAK